MSVRGTGEPGSPDGPGAARQVRFDYKAPAALGCLGATNKCLAARYFAWAGTMEVIFKPELPQAVAELPGTKTLRHPSKVSMISAA